MLEVKVSVLYVCPNRKESLSNAHFLCAYKDAELVTSNIKICSLYYICMSTA